MRRADAGAVAAMSRSNIAPPTQDGAARAAVGRADDERRSLGGAALASGIYVHPQAICESPNIGPGTRIWAFAHVLSGAAIGSDCNICDSVFVENDVVVGDRVTIKCGVQLWDGVRLADDVFVGPNVTFTNDPSPRSKVYPESFPHTEVGPGASLGANCTVLPGVRIGRGAMVGAGSVVTQDVPPHAIVVGNPARISGYTGAAGERTGAVAIASSLPQVRIPGARLVRLRRADDLRGSLVAGNFDGDLPFMPRRFFTVFGVPTKEVRGEHAHRTCDQLLVCLAGSISVVLDDGALRQEVVLDQPDVGLLIPAMVWGIQYQYSEESLLLVLASHDAEDYIREYDEFLEVKRRAAEPVA